jgi:hypothetical protein
MTTLTPRERQKTKQPIRDRFALKFNIDKLTGCWEWSGRRAKNGYGQMWCDGRTVSAHRLSYQLHYGAIPAGQYVCHHCDNRCCVNPNHLFLGTHADNMADRNAKGRQGRTLGSSHGMAKLTDADALSVLAAPGNEVRALAARLGVTREHLYRIRSGNKWPHLKKGAN